MAPLYDPAPPRAAGERAWDPGLARDAIAAICRDAESAFHPTASGRCTRRTMSPSPRRTGLSAGFTTARPGWCMRSTGSPGRASTSRRSTSRRSPAALRAALASPDEDDAGASLLVGSSGILLVAYRLGPSARRRTPSRRDRGERGAPVERTAARLPGHDARRPRDARAHRARSASRSCGGRARASCSIARRTDGLWTQDLYGSAGATSARATVLPATSRALTPRRSGWRTPAAVEARAVATARSDSRS